MGKVVDFNLTNSIHDENRARDVMAFAASTAVGLHNMMAQFGARQLRDFINGMTFCGQLVSRTRLGDGSEISFAETFEKKSRSYLRRIQTGEFDSEKEILGRHLIGTTELDPAPQLLITGAAAEGILFELAEELELSKSEMMDVVVFTITLAIAANSPVEFADLLLEDMIIAIEEKVALWDPHIPISDEIRELLE